MSPPKVNRFFLLVLGRANHNTMFQLNRLISFAVILLTHAHKLTNTETEPKTREEYYTVAGISCFFVICNTTKCHFMTDL